MKDNKISIVCLHRGFIPQLNISGPIVQPILVDKETVVKMLMVGLEISEFNSETKDFTKLTLDSIGANDVIAEPDPLPVNPIEEAPAIEDKTSEKEEEEMIEKVEPVEEVPASGNKHNKKNKK